MFFRHPSKRALREWLEQETHDPESTIDEHLGSCDRCAALLDELSEAEEYDLGTALAAIYTPPPDLSDRLERRVVERLDSRVVLDVVSDLFGAGIETSKLLLMEEPENE